MPQAGSLSNLVSAGRQLAAASDDPGAFAYAAGATWIAMTIAGAGPRPLVPQAASASPKATTRSRQRELKGTLAATQANDIAGSTGAVLIQGALLQTQLGDTLAATGAMTLKATASLGAADDIVSAAGAALIN